MDDVNDLRFNFDLRIDLSDMFRGGDRLWHSRGSIVFREHRLPLKICVFYEVTIGDSQSSNSGTTERFCLRRTQCPAADNQDSRSTDTLLPFSADLPEKDLPAIAIFTNLQLFSLGFHY
jgi:hypothetical protein